MCSQRKDKDGKHRFLIDGFPRQMDQAIQFDDTVSILYQIMRNMQLIRLCRSAQDQRSSS